MNCPKCNVFLILSDNKNIGIDYCPKCMGVWLDKKAFNKLNKKLLKCGINLNFYSKILTSVKCLNNNKSNLKNHSEK